MLGVHGGICVTDRLLSQDLPVSDGDRYDGAVHRTVLAAIASFHPVE